MKKFDLLGRRAFLIAAVPVAHAPKFSPSDLVYIGLDENFRVQRVWTCDENSRARTMQVAPNVIGSFVIGQLLPFSPIRLGWKQGNTAVSAETDFEFCSIAYTHEDLIEWCGKKSQEGGEKKMAIIVHKKAKADQADKAPATKKAPAKKAEKAPAKKAEAEGAGEGEE
jgi:hypothetical protein